MWISQRDRQKILFGKRNFALLEGSIMKGWIYLHRDVMNHWIWRNPRHFQWWVLLLLIAEWSPAKLQFGNAIVKVKRGEIATTIRVLAKQMNAPAKTVLSFLSILEQNEMIILTKKHRFTHIKIVNYERYQTPSNDALKEQKVKRKLQQIKEDNKYINNNTHTTRAREEAIIDEVVKSEDFVNECAKNLNCGIDKVKTMLDEFIGESRLTEKEHTDVSDFKRHFLNRAKIIIKNDGNKQSGQKAGGDKYEARRGTGVGAKTADDFHESF